jgi:Thiamine pyrophosphate enzyme, N-terminal TPP binding domain
MNKQVRQTGKSGTAKAVSVADYIVERLAAEGINHCFGVAGDYVFPICDAVDSSAKVKWIGWEPSTDLISSPWGKASRRGTRPQGVSPGLLLIGGLLDFPHKLGEAFGEWWLWGVVLFPQPASD